MKGLIITMFALTVSVTFAKDPIRQLNCQSKNPREFHVTLDPESYEEGSKLYHPKEARLRDNYYVVDEMVCTGAEIGDIVCMGYANGVSSIVIEAKTEQIGNEIVLHYETLRGNGPAGRTLKCKLN